MDNDILGILKEIQGRYLRSIGDGGTINPHRKDYSRAVIDKYLEERLGEDPAKYLNKIGMSLKTTPINTGNLIAVEPLRLASLNLMNLVHETWDTSELSKVLSGILILPLTVEARNLGQSYRRVGNAFIWIPSPEEIQGIKAEWEMFKGFAQKGAVPNQRGVSTNQLTYPTEATSKFIHMKPHSTKGKFELDAFGNQVRKMAFYLNSSKLRELIFNTLDT